MRIEISISVANDPDAHRWLDRILHKIEDGWHVWDTHHQPDPDKLEATTWVRNRGTQGNWVRRLFVASIQRSAWSLGPHERRVRVTANPNDANELTPEDATRLAEEPLVILVENRDSDGSFLKRIVAELDRSLNGVWESPGDPIRIDSVGGIGQMAAEITKQAGGVSYRPRLVAVADSDRKGPDDVESIGARNLRRECDRVGVSCWVLAKREAENYLPRILLAERSNAGAEHARLVDVWDRLTDDQKDFFDMEYGLSAEPGAIEEALFEGLSPADRSTLSRGFGRNVYKCWKVWNVRTNSELTRRGRGDLERGINTVRREV